MTANTRSFTGLPGYRPAPILWLLLALLIGGCGFQPRGGEADVRLQRIPQPLKITGIGRYSALHQALRRQAGIAGLATAAPGENAAAILHITDRKRTRRVLSLDDRNKAVEYELELSVRIRLQQDGVTRVEPQLVRVLRILYRPTTAVLGGNREESLLREDMREDLAEQVLQRIANQI